MEWSSLINSLQEQGHANMNIGPEYGLWESIK